MTSVLSRPVRTLAAVVGRRPLRSAGGLAALAAGGVVALGAGALDPGGATTADLLAFAVDHPAYPAAVVVGLATLLFLE